MKASPKPKRPNPQTLTSRCTGFYQTRYEPPQPGEKYGSIVRELVEYVPLRTPRNVRKAPRRGVFIPPAAAAQGMKLRPVSKHARQQANRQDGTRPRKPTPEEIAQRNRRLAADHPLPRWR